jgi:hypothetical protein
MHGHMDVRYSGEVHRTNCSALLWTQTVQVYMQDVTFESPSFCLMSPVKVVIGNTGIFPFRLQLKVRCMRLSQRTQIFLAPSSPAFVKRRHV